MAIHEHWIEAIQTDGFVFAENGCGPQVVQQLLSRSLERIDLVMDALDDRDIGIGSAAGFHELVQRSQGRWDLPISPQDFGVDTTFVGSPEQFVFRVDPGALGVSARAGAGALRVPTE